MHYRCPLESGGLSLRMFGRSSGGIRESPASFPARTLQHLSRKSVTPCRGLIRRSRSLGPLDSLIPHWTDPTPGRVDRFSRQPPRLKTGARPSSCGRRARARAISDPKRAITAGRHIPACGLIPTGAAASAGPAQLRRAPRRSLPSVGYVLQISPCASTLPFGRQTED